VAISVAFAAAPTAARFTSIPARSNLVVDVRRAEIRTAEGKLALDIYPHLFRQVVGTRMVSDNIPLTVIQELLGHGSIEMTACAMTRSRVGTSGSTSTASRQRRTCCSGIPRSQHAGLSAGSAKHPLVAKPRSRAAAPRAGARERARSHDRAGSSSAATRRLVSRIPEMLLATAASTSEVTRGHPPLAERDAHVPRLTIAAMGRGCRSRWFASRRTVGPTIAFGRTHRIASSERPIPTRFLCHERDRGALASATIPLLARPARGARLQ
jgi:Phage integrase family